MLYDIKLTGFNSDEIIMIDLCMKVLNYDASRAYDCIDNMPSLLIQGVDMNRVKEIKAAFESEGAILEVVPTSSNDNTTNQNNNVKTNNNITNKTVNTINTNNIINQNNTINTVNNNSYDNKDSNKKHSTGKKNKKSLLDVSNEDIMNLKFNPYENNNGNVGLENNNYENNSNVKLENNNYENNSNVKLENNNYVNLDSTFNSGENFSDAMNIVENNMDISTDGMTEKRNIKYGRRSSDIDPRTVNYGRRSTDMNPMLYSEENNSQYEAISQGMQGYNVSNEPFENESLGNEDTYLSDYGNTIIEKNKSGANGKKNNSSHGHRKNKNEQSPYGGLGERTRRQSPYGGLGERTRNNTEYGGLGERKNSTAYGGLGERKNSTAYGGLGERKNSTAYGGLGERKNSTAYGGLGERKNSTAYGGLEGRNNTTYGEIEGSRNNTAYGVENDRKKNSPFGRVEERQNTAEFYDVNGRDALDSSTNIPPYSKRLEKNNQNNSINDEVGNIRNIEMLDSNSEHKQNINSKFEVPKFENSPYENSTINFTQQQHFGTIDKDDKPDDLYDLSAIERNKKISNASKNRLDKNQVVCPKCGSAFVSTKRGQGIFGTSKIKYVCEACKNKF